ncbi:serine hydrolase [Candidatus Neomarinimicrobiota bacterium]
MRTLVLTCLLWFSIARAQNTQVPEYYVSDERLSKALLEIVTDLNLNKDFFTGEDGWEQISLAVIDLTREPAHFGGVQADNFIYPASVYKMYVAAEILNQVSDGELTLETAHVVRAPNDVDQSKGILWDPRPLMRDGDTVTVNYLLDLMITRSDNSAANCLIDIAQRENINALMHRYHWEGSEVTRKFLSRKYEDPGYEKIHGTETSALHAADFLYRIETDQLVNPWVSQQLKTLLGRQLDSMKMTQGLPANAMFYHKTGWFSYWTHDVGIVDDGKVRYVVACFLPLEEDLALMKHKELARRIYQLMTALR